MKLVKYSTVGILILLLSGITEDTHSEQITFKQFYHYGSVSNEFTEADNRNIKNGISGSLDKDTIAGPEKARFQIQGQVYSNNWMSYLDPSLAFKDLNIPGTHDTMSYRHYNSEGLYARLALLSAYHQTQSANLRNQLDSGIRYIDIRIGNKDGIMTARHATTDMKTRFDTILETLKRFLDENPGEVVFMRLKKEDWTDHTNNTFAFILESYIRGERFLEKRPSGNKGSGWTACVWREVSWPNSDHYWCRKPGNDIKLPGAAVKKDNYQKSYIDYIYTFPGLNYNQALNYTQTTELTLHDILGNNPGNGRIVILKNFTDNEKHTDKGKEDPNSCNGNQTPNTDGDNHCTKYAQIVYDSSAFSIQDDFSPKKDGDKTDKDVKKEKISDQLAASDTRSDNDIYFNHLSANKGTSSTSPRSYAEIMNPYTYDEMTGISYTGFIIGDYLGQDLIRAVVKKNAFNNVEVEVNEIINNYYLLD